eukprot:3212330-Rhodomonas_salina.3
MFERGPAGGAQGPEGSAHQAAPEPAHDRAQVFSFAYQLTDALNHMHRCPLPLPSQCPTLTSCMVSYLPTCVLRDAQYYLRVWSRTCLRARYAMSGTDAWRMAQQCPVLTWRMVSAMLRADIAYRSMRMMHRDIKVRFRPNTRVHLVSLSCFSRVSRFLCFFFPCVLPEMRAVLEGKRNPCCTNRRERKSSLFRIA